jgi:hypothetical protein
MAASADGRDVHDPALGISSKMGQRRHRDIVGCPEMNLHCFLKIRFRHRLTGSYEHDAGIVDQYVNTSVFFSNSRNGLFDFARFPHITGPG